MNNIINDLTNMNSDIDNQIKKVQDIKNFIMEDKQKNKDIILKNKNEIKQLNLNINSLKAQLNKCNEIEKNNTLFQTELDNNKKDLNILNQELDNKKTNLFNQMNNSKYKIIKLQKENQDLKNQNELLNKRANDIKLGKIGKEEEHPYIKDQKMMTTKMIKTVVKKYIDEKYDDNDFIEYYADWSTIINSILRIGYPKTKNLFKHMDGHYAPDVQLGILNGGLKLINEKKTLVFEKDIILYRVINENDTNVSMNEILNDKAFKSTSYTKNIRGCKDNVKVLRIFAPKGTRFFPVGYNDDELILLPKYKFKLLRQIKQKFKSNWKQKSTCNVNLYDVIIY